MGTQLPLFKKGAEPPIFYPCLLCLNGWMDHDMPLGMEVRLDPSDIVLDGDPAARSPKRGQSPLHFWSTSIVAKHLHGSRCHLVWTGGRPRPGHHCVRCGPSYTPRGAAPQISAHVCFGQTAGWIKMSLGTKVGLGPGHIVLHGDPAPPSQKGSSSQFSANAYCGQTVAHLSCC